MTDTSGFDHDDELREMLRGVDPASSLSPADPHVVARLLEDTMSSDLNPENRETGTRGRSPLTWLVAAAAVLLIVGGGMFGLINHDKGSNDVPTAVDTTGTPEPTVTQLAAPASTSAKCMVPNAELLSRQTIAFEGAVREIAEGRVVLVPSTFYVGEVTDLVEVEAPAADMTELVGAVDFRVGESYLVSATDGRVTVCGFSGPVTPELSALYAEAFPG